MKFPLPVWTAFKNDFQKVLEEVLTIKFQNAQLPFDQSAEIYTPISRFTKQVGMLL